MKLSKDDELKSFFFEKRRFCQSAEVSQNFWSWGKNQEMEELVNDENVLQREIPGPILGKALEFVVRIMP